MPEQHAHRLADVVSRRLASADRLMWVTPERVFYVGLLGAPALHVKGALCVYVAVEGGLRVRLQGGPWETAEVAVIPPYCPFEIASQGRHVLYLSIEPETIDFDRLPPMLRVHGAVDAPQFAPKARHAHHHLMAEGRDADLRAQDFDALFFDAPLPTRRLDPRIAAALQTLDHAPGPGAQATAQACADQANLSFSRFLHLFKEETGASFRSVRAWKRARSLLQYVNRDDALVYVALDLGYPDSTHFSHSIRRFYGLKPRDIFAGSRKLRILDAQTASSAGMA